MPNSRITAAPPSQLSLTARCRIHQPLFLVRFQPISFSFPRICYQNLDGPGAQMIRGSIGNGVQIEAIQPELTLTPPFSPDLHRLQESSPYFELHTVSVIDWESSVRILFDFPFATATQHAAHEKKKRFCETVIIRRSVSVARC